MHKSLAGYSLLHATAGIRKRRRSKSKVLLAEGDDLGCHGGQKYDRVLIVDDYFGSRPARLLKRSGTGGSCQAAAAHRGPAAELPSRWHASSDAQRPSRRRVRHCRKAGCAVSSRYALQQSRQLFPVMSTPGHGPQSVPMTSRAKNDGKIYLSHEKTATPADSRRYCRTSTMRRWRA